MADAISIGKPKHVIKVPDRTSSSLGRLINTNANSNVPMIMNANGLTIKTKILDEPKVEWSDRLQL
jgi:hypothetical protein